MSSKLAQRTKFEAIPNEVLLEIFEYLRSSDVFHAFYYLNTRYNQFLVSLQPCLDLLDVPKKTFDFHNYLLIPLMSNRIVGLRCEDVFHRLTYQIRLANLPALKYLTLSNLREEALAIILPQVNNLNQLVHLSLTASPECDLGHPVVLDGHWPFLQTCVLDLHQPITFASDHIHTQLRSLTINRCSIEGLGMFICRCIPQLEHLTVSLIDGKVCEATDDVHPLKTLTIDESHVPFHRLTKSVLAFFPSLQRLCIRNGPIEYIDGKPWEVFLSAHCRQLRQFRLRVQFRTDMIPTWPQRTALLQPLSTPYFSSRGWHFALADCSLTRRTELFSMPMINCKRTHDLYDTMIAGTRDDVNPFADTDRLSVHLARPTVDPPIVQPCFAHVRDLELVSDFREHQAFPKTLLVDIARLVSFSQVTSLEFHSGCFPACSLALLSYAPKIHSLTISLRDLIKMTKMLQDQTVCRVLSERITQLTIKSMNNTRDLPFYERLPIVFARLNSLTLFVSDHNDLYILMTLLLTKMARTLQTMDVVIDMMRFEKSVMDQFMLWLPDFMNQRDLSHTDVKFYKGRLSFGF